MNFLIVTHVEHFINEKGEIGAYSPYVREMNLWGKYVDQLTIIAPATKQGFSAFDVAYVHPNIKLVQIPLIAFNTPGAIVKSLFQIPGIMLKMMQQMRKADHIHLRTPGNVGMFGCFAQIFFPGKKKTAKYAGNWDPAYKNPLSYSIQKAMLANTLLSTNIEVIVYGKWPGATKNIKDFFTATYFKNEIEPSFVKDYSGKPVFMFSGVMDERKDPFFTYEIFKAIKRQLPDAELHFCGAGILMDKMQQQIATDGLTESVILHGAMTKEQMKQQYKASHFLIFFTKTSEGWPKAVAESLFWGVLPVTKPISVVSQMTDNGGRGLLFTKPEINDIANTVVALWHDKTKLDSMSKKGMEWSQPYTLDRFEAEIKKLI